MLRSIGIKNFKSYRDATLPLATLTLLIGANASGKSNLVEVLRLLRWMAEGRRLSEIRSDEPVRGKVAEYFLDPGQSIELTVRETDCDVLLDLKMGQFGLEFSNETLRSRTSGLLYSTARKGDDRQSIVSGLGVMRPLEFSADEPVFRQMANHPSVRDNKELTLTWGIAGNIEAQLKKIAIFDPIPSRMRGYADLSFDRLLSDGSNLAWIISKPDNRSQKKDLLALIESVPEQRITAIEPFATERGDAMIRVREKFGEREEWRDAPLLSDGTLRVLAIGTALLDVPEGSLVVIEEIDNGVHPSRAKHLMHKIKEVAERRNLQVMLSTHNPALMDAIPDTSLQDVVFCYRDPQEGDSRLVRLGDLDQPASLLAQGSLGDLVTQGVLDRLVKTRPSPEDAAKQEAAWMEELEGLASR